MNKLTTRLFCLLIAFIPIASVAQDPDRSDVLNQVQRWHTRYHLLDQLSKLDGAESHRGALLDHASDVRKGLVLLASQEVPALNETLSPLLAQSVKEALLITARLGVLSPEEFDPYLKTVSRFGLEDADYYYIIGLAYYRYTERVARDANFSVAKGYLESAVLKNPEHAEAHWLLSQIAAFGGDRASIRSHCQAVRDSKVGLRPAMYLYDLRTIRMILDAVVKNTH